MPQGQSGFLGTVVEAKITTERLGVAANSNVSLMAFIGGQSWRFFACQKSDDSSETKCVLPRAEAYPSSPLKKVAGTVQGPLDAFLRDQSIPLRTLSINLTDGELFSLLRVPLALNHMDNIQEYQSAIHSPTACYQVSQAGL